MYNKDIARLNLYFGKIQCVRKMRVANLNVTENTRVKKTFLNTLNSIPRGIAQRQRSRYVECFPGGDNQVLFELALQHRLFTPTVISQAFIG